MSLRITDCVAAQARRAPLDPAIIDVRERSVCVWTWEKLWRESGRIAALLLRLAVQPGEVVAYQLPNQSEFVAITLAALRIGAICCPLLPIYRAHDLTFMLTRSRARVLFAADQFRGRRPAAEIASLEPTLSSLKHLIVVKTGESTPQPPLTRRLTCTRLYRAVAAGLLDQAAIDERRPEPDALAQLMFTSGTAGPPRVCCIGRMC